MSTGFRTFGLALVAAIPALGAITVGAASPGSVEQASDSAIAAAIAGGITLVCRHAMTDDTNETEPVDYDDASTQRLLSPEGERQSANLGAAMNRLGVRVAELIASPMSRARRTAELMFDRPVTIDSIWHTNGASYRGPALRERERVLASPIEGGTRVIISHIGTISSAIPSARGEMAEGDCVAVGARESGHRVIGFVPWRAWLEAAG